MMIRILKIAIPVEITEQLETEAAIRKLPLEKSIERTLLHHANNLKYISDELTKIQEEAAATAPPPPEFKEWSRSMITEFYSTEDEIENPKWPLTPEVIPNHMGINLCSVEGMSWTRQAADRQLVSLTIHFLPA
jgi:hypothetical protein